jgi:hypothetical protein
MAWYRKIYVNYCDALTRLLENGTNQVMLAIFWEKVKIGKKKDVDPAT